MSINDWLYIFILVPLILIFFPLIRLIFFLIKIRKARLNAKKNGTPDFCILYTEPPYFEKEQIDEWTIYYYLDKERNTFIQLIDCKGLPSDYRFNDWEDTIKADKNNYENVKVIKITTFLLGNTRAAEYVCECSFGDEDLVLRYVDLTNGKKIVSFVLSSIKTEYNLSKKVLDNMLWSVKWQNTDLDFRLS